VNIRYFAGSMELTDQAIKQARGNEGAFVNLLENDRKLLAQDMKKNVNRQVFGAGNGVITDPDELAGGGHDRDRREHAVPPRQRRRRHRHRRERHRPRGERDDHGDQPHDEDADVRHRTSPRRRARTA
jgi:hypothetical protein